MPADPEQFKRSGVIEPGPQRLSICFISLDYPPGSMGGIARYTVRPGARNRGAGPSRFTW